MPRRKSVSKKTIAPIKWDLVQMFEKGLNLTLTKEEKKRLREADKSLENLDEDNTAEFNRLMRAFSEVLYDVFEAAVSRPERQVKKRRSNPCPTTR